MSSRPGDRTDPVPGSLERTLWVTIYALLALAPVALLTAVPPFEDSDEVFVPVAIGFVALTVLALQVVVPSRAPSFTSPFGIDVIIRFHRRAGLFAVVLVGAHVATVVLAEDDRLEWLDPSQGPLAGRLGLAAVVLLVALAITALWRKAFRLRYEAWRGLHVVLGLAVLGFAFGHVLAVSRFSDTGTIRWLVLGFVVAALLAAFYLRVARPFLAARRPYVLRTLRRERDGALTLELEAVDHPGAPFIAGQFAWLKHAGATYALTEHPFSYASSALEPQRPRFTIKPVGDFTRALADLEPGARLLVDGPHGSPAIVDDRDCVLIAGGSGITPALSALRTAADQADRRQLMLIHLTRSVDEVPFVEELEELSRRLDLRVVHVPSRAPADWEGPSGRVDERLLDSLLPADRGRRSYFVCGPPGMTDVVTRALEQLGVARAAIRAERYSFA